MTEEWGVASLVCSIVGLLLFFFPPLGLVVSILAIVFYAVQKKRGINGIATAGLVLGIVGTVINGTILLFVLFLFLMVALTA